MSPRHRLRPAGRALAAAALALGGLLLAGRAAAQVPYPGGTSTAPPFGRPLDDLAAPTSDFGSVAPFGATPTTGFGVPGAQPGGALGTPASQGGTEPGAPAGPPAVALPTAPITLTGAAVGLDVTVTNAPAFGEFELTVAYDPAVLALTGVEPGALVSGAGGTIRPVSVMVSAPGIVRYGLAIDGASPAPSGTGVLARLGFAPLALTQGSPISLTEALLVASDGQRISATPGGSTVVVTELPGPEAQSAQATAAVALAAATPDAAGALGTVPAGGGLGLGGLLGGAMSPAVLWFSIALAGLLVAAAGWAVGRRA